MHITVHRRLAEAQDDWSRVESAGQSLLFQSQAWGSIWLHTIGQALGVSPRLVHVDYPGGELFLPLILERGRFGVRRLGFLDGGLTDHAAPIVSHGTLPSPAQWRKLARRIACAAGADVMDLRHLTPLIAERPNPLRNHRSSQTAYASHRLDIAGTWADFSQQRLSTSYRAGGRRKLRKLERAGNVRFVSATSVEEGLALLDIVMALKAEQNTASNRTNHLAKPAYRAFYREMTQRHLGSGLVRVSALVLEDTLLAGHWGCAYRNEFHWLMPAYDVAWSQYSPGRLLLDYLVERCFNEGLSAFEFTIGDEPYKSAYADRHVHLARSLHPRTARGLAYAWRARREGRPPSA